MKIHNLSEVIRQLYVVLDEKQRRKGIVIFIISLVGGLFEMIGVTAIIPFMTAILSPNVLKKNYFIAKLIEIFNIRDNMSLMILMTIGLIAIYIIKNVYLTIAAYLKFKFQCQVQSDLSIYLMNSFEKRPYTFFLNINSADILSGVTKDVAGVYSILDNCLRSLSESITVLFIMITIILMDWTMALSIGVFAGGTLLIVFSIFYGKIRKLGVVQREMMIQRYKQATESIHGIKDIKVMHREDNFIEKFAKTVKTQMQADQSYYFAGSCPERIIETVCIGGVLIIVAVKFALGVDVNTFIPNLAALAIAAFRILPSISKISGYLNGIVYFRPTLQSAYDNVLEARKQEKYMVSQEKGMQNLEFFNKIEVKNISWHYPDKERNVLQRLSMYIKKGESVGFIGASGAGKTTLGDLILGLYKPQLGDILVDGKSIYLGLNQWSKIIGYVSQSVYLIDDTIRNNVTFGIDEKDIGDDKVWKALEQAQLVEFVKSLPDQLDTIVGERGVKFSGGQRQRVAIARALYYNPDILILDEATSALDNETESAVMESIELLQGYKTLIIIAHRLSTIEQCDRVYEIAEGVAIEKKKEEIF